MSKKPPKKRKAPVLSRKMPARKSPAGVRPARGPVRKTKPLHAIVRMDFDDTMRRALNYHYGLPGKASLADCRLWMETTITSTWSWLAIEYEKDTLNGG